MAAPGHQVQVVRFDENSDGFQFQRDNLREICDKCGDLPISVISVTGEFRKGKSFLLNFFLRYLHHVRDQQEQERGGDPEGDQHDAWLNGTQDRLEGFSWRGGSRPETTGILFWSEPIVVRRPDGRQVAVLLMDTQGLFDARQTLNQSIAMFALSTLISSLQVYNVAGNIKEDNLHILDAFLAYGQLVLDRSPEKPFQKLCFLVRDWSSPVDHEYGASGGNARLEEAFKLEAVRPDNTNAEYRRRIEDCFEQMACFLMPYPGTAAAVTTDREFVGQIADMDQEFVNHLKDFVLMVLAPENLLIKRIGGQDLVGGRTFLDIFDAYANNLIQGSLPDAGSLFEATARASHQLAFNKAVESYKRLMENYCQRYLEPPELLEVHTRAKRESVNVFNGGQRLGDQVFSGQYLQRLCDELQEIFKNFENLNTMMAMYTGGHVAAAATAAVLVSNIGKIANFSRFVAEVFAKVPM